MAGDTVIQGAQPVEWIEESSFSTGESDPAMNWFGIGTSWSVDQGVEEESITYLPEHGSSNKLEKRVNTKLREMYNGEVTYNPQDFDLLQYFTGASGGTGDDPSTIQVGEVNESVSPDEFRRLMGGIGEEVTLSVEEDGVAEISGSFIFAGRETWGDIDYAKDSTITSLGSAVTPESDNSVGVQTQSVDTGDVILYDGSDNQLARVSADSSNWVAADVGGTDVAKVRLVNISGTVSSETITVNGETDGSGANESTADVGIQGTHASEDSSEPLSFDDLSNVQWGGNDMDGAVESIEVSISNDIAEVRDSNKSRGTQIASLIPVDREITVDISLTYDSFNMLSDIRSYTAKDLTFDLGSTSFTISNVKFPEQPYEFTADDLVSDTVSSAPATDISWS